MTTKRAADMVVPGIGDIAYLSDFYPNLKGVNDGSVQGLLRTETSVMLSAYETGSGRRSRLVDVLNYVLNWSSYYGNHRLEVKIERLHDYKGILVVFWRETPTPGEMDWIREAWERHGEQGSDIEHLRTW